VARESGRDWSPASRVEADAQGPSGQRVFRLLVETPETSAVLAIEKEQLQFLAMLVEQILTGLPAVQVRNPDLDQSDEIPAGVGFPAYPDVTFRIARLSLGIDEERDVFVLMAYESEDDQETPPTFGCLVSRSQIRRLSRQISRLVAAGRPRCPLCQTPLDGGPHHCSGSNGHVASTETD
jgi:uncharacterized repeat protein (TIGR03847 family)